MHHSTELEESARSSELLCERVTVLLLQCKLPQNPWRNSCLRGLHLLHTFSSHSAVLTRDLKPMLVGEKKSHCFGDKFICPGVCLFNKLYLSPFSPSLSFRESEGKRREIQKLKHKGIKTEVKTLRFFKIFICLYEGLLFFYCLTLLNYVSSPA